MRAKTCLKVLAAAIFMVILTLLGTTVAFADCFGAPHSDPGADAVFYAYDASECNRKINITYKLSDGTQVKKITLHTKHGVDESAIVSLGGYDITKMSSNQGLWETCKFVLATCGCGLGASSSIHFHYYFRTALSQDELNISVTVRKWDKIQFVERHYVQWSPDQWYRYESYAKTGQKELNYCDSFTSNCMNIPGYTLRSDYESAITDKLCLVDLSGKYKNTEGRNYSYDLHNLMLDPRDSHPSSYDETKDGKLDYCDSRLVWVDYYYDITEYTVNYNTNGGNGTYEAQTKYHGYDLTLSDVAPTRSGYTFQGWGTSATDTTPDYQPGGNFSANSNTTLYAIWKSDAPVEYKVYYNANGGTGAPATQTKTHNVNLTLSRTRPTRTGYTFKGWSTTSGGVQAVMYTPGATYTANATVYLYAVWKQVPTEYTVTYDANGGTGAPAQQKKQLNVTLTLSSTIPTRSGYTFLGWGLDPVMPVPDYYAGGSYTANVSVTLYAIWKETPPVVYTVTFDPNGGEGGPSPMTKTHGVTAYLPVMQPWRTNYTFKGWSTDPNAVYPVFYAGGAYTINGNVTLYAVWEYDPIIYTITYDANGGSGAPAAQSKTHGTDITLSTTKPTRYRYNFKGWSTDINATTATYQPGATYSANASATLYAVWEAANYDFSISNLTVSDTEPYKYGQITVKVRTDNWDQVNAYSNIPVQLYYGGTLIGTKNVNFSAYGVANLTFTVNIGSGIGDKTIEARINWSDHLTETRTGNNSVSTTIHVKDYNYDMSGGAVTDSASITYTEGSTVITSFTVTNDSDFDIVPSLGNTIRFRAFLLENGVTTIISDQRRENFVVPKGGTNLVYFKWDVPDNLAGKTVYCFCYLNADNTLNEDNTSNNTVAFSTVIAERKDSQPPHTRYESTKPSTYQNTSLPTATTDSATWTQWVYENGGFQLKTYGIQIQPVNPVIAPSADCTTAVNESGQWKMGSGYGFTISYTPVFLPTTGSLPDSSAYTLPQEVVVRFPEFNYSDTDGTYRTLEYVNNQFRFAANPEAVDNGRIHFIPVWFENGNYAVSVEVTQLWTPVGVINAVRNSNAILIDGTMFDDFYVGGN